MRRPTAPSRAAAAAGAAGCVAFVGAWAAAGASVQGYRPTHDTISRLAASGAPHQVAMTAAIAGYGVGLVAFGAGVLRPLVPGPAWTAAVASGLCTLGVAATPLGSPARDAAHDVFAGVGYATLAAAPLLAARRWQHGGLLHRRASWSRAAGLAASVSLVLSLGGHATGFWQRAGLSAGDAWVVAVAVATSVDPGPAHTGHTGRTASAGARRAARDAG